MAGYELASTYFHFGVRSADWSVGQLLSTLKELGILDNTLIIVSSDNGPILNDGYDDHAEELLNGCRDGVGDVLVFPQSLAAAFHVTDAAYAVDY